MPLGRYLKLQPRQRLLATAAVTLLLLLLAWVDRQGLFLYNGSDLGRYHQRWFVVTHVVDGDTLDVDIPDGDKKVTRVRLWGIDAPETAKPRFGQAGEPWADQATQRLAEVTLNQRVRLWVEPSRVRDRYGRLLAHVELADSRFANEILLLEGLARDDQRWPHGREQRYRLLAEQARRDRAGLWSGTPPLTSDAAGRRTFEEPRPALAFADLPPTMSGTLPLRGAVHRAGIASLPHPDHHRRAPGNAPADDPADRDVSDAGPAWPNPRPTHSAAARRPGRVLRTDAATRRPTSRPAILGSHPRRRRRALLSDRLSPLTPAGHAP